MNKQRNLMECCSDKAKKNDDYQRASMAFLFSFDNVILSNLHRVRDCKCCEIVHINFMVALSTIFCLRDFINSSY